MAEIRIEDIYSKGKVALQVQVEQNRKEIEDLKLSGGQPVLSAAWVQLRTAMWNGYVPADGQVLKRVDYPDAWKAIEAGLVPLVGDQDWQDYPQNRGCFTAGDGSTTFRVPDYNGKFDKSLGAVFLRGDGLNAGPWNGNIQGDAIRNITGNFAVGASTGITTNAGPYTTGAFAMGGRSHTSSLDAAPGAAKDLLFDASRVVPTAADNHPVNVTGCWAIKLFGAVQNQGEIDAATLATQLAEAQSKIAELEQYPKVIKMSDIFECTSVWAANDLEFNVVEHKDYYHIQGIFRTVSGGAAGGVLGSFKRNIRFSYTPCAVTQSPSSAPTYAYIERGWADVEYGRPIQLMGHFINSSWVMISFIVVKEP